MPRRFPELGWSIRPRARLLARGPTSLRASDIILGTVVALGAVFLAAMLLSRLFAPA